MAKIRPKGIEGSKWQIPILKNISKGGCCFIGGNAYKAGQFLEMEIQFPTLEDPMRFVVMVVRNEVLEKSNPPLNKTGVKFVKMDDMKIDRFSEAIEFFLKKEKG